jgi:hypothetical protein
MLAWTVLPDELPVRADDDRCPFAEVGSVNMRRFAESDAASGILHHLRDGLFHVLRMGPEEVDVCGK